MTLAVEFIKAGKKLDGSIYFYKKLLLQFFFFFVDNTEHLEPICAHFWFHVLIYKLFSCENLPASPL